jgi:hypothetical protein
MGFGFVHRSRTVFCRFVPNPNITIRHFFIAVPHERARGRQRVGRGGSQACGGLETSDAREGGQVVHPQLRPTPPHLVPVIAERERAVERSLVKASRDVERDREGSWWAHTGGGMEAPLPSDHQPQCDPVMLFQLNE